MLSVQLCGVISHLHTFFETGSARKVYQLPVCTSSFLQNNKADYFSRIEHFNSHSIQHLEGGGNSVVWYTQDRNGGKD